MKFSEIKEAIMFQTNNDAEDLGDYLPAVDDYVNEGYGLLAEAVYGEQVARSGKYPPLSGDGDEPKLPEWLHRALCDYGTWMAYRNGNQLKQNRGYVFRQAFEQQLSKARLWAARQKNGNGQFYNIYP